MQTPSEQDGRIQRKEIARNFLLQNRRRLASSDEIRDVVGKVQETFDIEMVARPKRKLPKNTVRDTSTVILTEEQKQEAALLKTAQEQKIKDEDNLALYLKDQKERAQDDAAREAEETEKKEQQNLTAGQARPMIPAPNTQPEPLKTSESEILLSKLQHNTARKNQIERQIKQLDRNTNQIDKQIQYIKDREQGDIRNLAEADQYIKKLEDSGPSWKEQKIENLSAHIKDLEERVLAKLDAAVEIKDPKESEKQLQEANSDLLQVGMLSDKLAVMKGEKTMLDKDCNPVDSFDKAEFFVPKEKQIVKDEKGNFCLLNKGEELTDNNTEKAQRDFTKQRQQLTSVRSDVERFKNQQQALESEKTFLTKAKEALGLEKNKLQTEINNIEGKLKELGPPKPSPQQKSQVTTTMAPPCNTPESDQPKQSQNRGPS